MSRSQKFQKTTAPYATSYVSGQCEQEKYHLPLLWSSIATPFSPHSRHLIPILLSGQPPQPQLTNGDLGYFDLGVWLAMAFLFSVAGLALVSKHHLFVRFAA